MRARFVVGITAIGALALCASALATGPVAGESAKRPLLISN